MRLVALLLVFGCSTAAPSAPPPARAFYYWRTTFALTAAERRALRELAVDKLYLRAFDVAPGRDDAPQLLGVVQVTAAPALPQGLEVVPVVFLKNQLFASEEPAADRVLAQQVWQGVAHLGNALGNV